MGGPHDSAIFKWRRSEQQTRRRAAVGLAHFSRQTRELYPVVFEPPKSFVALDLPHYPRTSHLILRSFQCRQHADVGQIQNLLETAPDHEVNVGFARSVSKASGRYPGLSFVSSSRGDCRNVQRFECATRSEAASKHLRTAQPGLASSFRRQDFDAQTTDLRIDGMGRRRQ